MYRWRKLKRWVNPAILVVAAAMLVGLYVGMKPPSEDRLLEVRARVDSYSFESVKEQQDDAARHNIRSARDPIYTRVVIHPTTILSLEEGQTGLPNHQFPQVSTDALDEEQAHKLFGVLPVEIRVFVDPEQRRRTSGALHAYGLQVDGREIESVQSALDRSRRWLRDRLALLGITIALGVWQKHRYETRQRSD